MSDSGWRRVRNGILATPPGRAARRWVRSRRQGRMPRALGAEMEKLELRAGGVAEDGVPWIELADGTRLFGYPMFEEDPERYASLPASFRARIPPEAIRAAQDAVLRYAYPHALCHLTPSAPPAERGGFYGLHLDTIADLDLDQAERSRMYDRFVLEPGDTVLEVGSYIGFGVVRMARLVGPTGRVLCVEADPRNQALIARNVDSAGLDNVTLFRCGVWSEPGSFTLNIGSGGTRESSIVDDMLPSDHAIEVPTRTVDDIVAESGVTRLDLVSLTINGAEVEALEGMSHTLQTLRPAISIAGWLDRSGTSMHELLIDRLRQAGGYAWTVGPHRRVYAWPTDGVG